MKTLRVYLKQPSPNWLEFTIRDVQLFMKKTAKQQQSYLDTRADKVASNPFDAFKSQIKRNLKNMKKDQEQNASPYPAAANEDGGQISPREMETMAKYSWTEEVPSYIYHEDVRKSELHYNVL